MPPDEISKTFPRLRAVAEFGPERSCAGADKVIAQMLTSRPSLCRLSRHTDRAFRDARLVRARTPGDPLDSASIAVTSPEALLRVNAGRFAPQNRFDLALGLEEGVPVKRGEQSQADDAIGHGDLVRRL